MLKREQSIPSFGWACLVGPLLLLATIGRAVEFENILLNREVTSWRNSVFEHNGLIYFIPYSEQSGYELWRSDGTEEGTFLVRDINDDQDESGAGVPVSGVGENVFFQGTDEDHGSELWRSNGTTAGTFRVIDVVAGSRSGVERLFPVAPSLLYFKKHNSHGDTELWKTDTTAAGTIKIKTLTSAVGGISDVTGIHLLDSHAVLSVSISAEFTEELWGTDGTEAGTLRLPIPRGIIRTHRSTGGALYVMSRQADSSYQLWRTDGTISGTVRLGILPVPQSLEINDLVGLGEPRWTELGSRTYISMSYDLCEGPGDDPYCYVVHYFARTDGTPEGTLGLQFQNYIDEKLVTCNGRLLANYRFNNQDSLCVVNDDGVLRASPIAPGLKIMGPEVLLGDVLYFAGRYSNGGTQLWRTDSTAEGTWELARGAGGTSLNPGYFTAYHNLFFFITGSYPDYTLHVSDGTVAGTGAVPNAHPLFDQSSGPPYIAAKDSLLYGDSAGLHMLRVLSGNSVPSEWALYP